LVAAYRKYEHDRSDLINAIAAIQPGHPLILEYVSDRLRRGQHDENLIKALGDKSFASLFGELLAYAKKESRKSGFALDRFADNFRYKQFARLPEARQQQIAAVMAGVISKTTDENTRGYACKVIQLLGKGGSAALELVREILKTPDPAFAVYNALHALGRMGPKGAPARPEVEKLLQNKGFRSLAAAVLATIEPGEAPRALRVLRDELTKKDDTFRNDALAAIACLGPTAGEFRPEIEKLAARPGENQQWAKIALGATSDPIPIIKSFVDDLRSSEKDKRIGACTALVALQKYARPAIPVLRAMIKKDPENTIFYAGAIYEISQVRVWPMVWGFNCIPGGYPW